jgi:hypothetical protein
VTQIRRTALAVALLLAAPVHADVSLDETQRAQLDLATQALVGGRDEGDVEATGRVLDSVALIDAALARASARSIAQRTARELARVAHLSRGAENASQRDLEAAADADQRAQLDLDAAQARFTAAWGAQLSESAELGTLLRRLSQRDAAITRVDIPAGAESLGDPSVLRVAIATQPAQTLPARLIGPAPSVDPLVQGNGWLVLIETNPPAAGAALVATLRFAARAFDGVVIPHAALLHGGGHAFVYVEREPGAFARIAVTPLRSTDDGWLASSALAPGDRVVVRGAQELLATEMTPPQAAPD